MNNEYTTYSNGTSRKASDTHKLNASKNFTNTGSVRESQLEKKHDDWNTVI